MEALTQFVIPLTRRVKQYRKNTRHDIIEDVYRNKIVEVIHYRCRSCGQFKAPDSTTRCENCTVQLEMFV